MSVKNLHSDSWCPIPFNAISFHPTGNITRCMMSNKPMGESYDSAEMQQLRQNMLNGIWDQEGCMSCWVKESNNNISQRQKWLQRNPYDFISQQGYTHPKLAGNPINHMFINYSNICNFKCRMCSPAYSNSLIPEHKHLVNIGAKKPINEDLTIKNRNFINDYLRNDPDALKYVNSIWITGGEPFMDDSCYELVDILGDKIFNTDIVITTNGSKLDLDKLQRFEYCKFFEIDLSIDAPGPMFEYMRSAGLFTWEQMSKLIDDLKHFKKQNSSWFNLCLNSSLQAYNFDTVIEFNEMCLNTGALNNSRLLVFPENLKLDVLPVSIRKQELQKLEKYKIQDTDPRYKRFFNDILSSMNVEQSNKMSDFISITKAQDSFRNMFLYDYHKELGEIVYG